jgi:DNA-binding XRE family transcriptional regulator
LRKRNTLFVPGYPFSSLGFVFVLLTGLASGRVGVSKPRPAGPVIRVLRQRKGIKVGTLARQVGVSAKHLSNIEGAGGGASPELLHRLAAALGVSIDDITTHDRDAGEPGG